MSNELKILQGIYLKHLEEKTIPLPRIIHVETRSKCNGSCSFCPASITSDKREDVYMPDELIGKIIDELSEWDYVNRLSFYNNNEPFLDKRIYNIVQLSRNKILKSYLELKSNGKVLTTENIIRIFNSGLDMLYINDYSNNGKFSKNVQHIKDDTGQIRRFKGHFERDQYFSRIVVELRDINAIAGTRAGSSPNKPYTGDPVQKACYRPFEMMTIDPEGNVSVCSEDIYHTISMGNINDQTLHQIWTSKEWNDMRKHLIMGDRSCTEACSKCDYKGVTEEMYQENGIARKRKLLEKLKALYIAIK